MKRVLLIPLDERDCNYTYVKSLAKVISDVTLITPPKSMLGKFRNPADLNRLWNYLDEHISEVDYAILSIDTLLYGNIINSRIHNQSLEECKNRLNHLVSLKIKNPKVTIMAYNLVTRVANNNVNSEDPIYWSDFGEHIWRMTFLQDKIDRLGDKSEESAEAHELSELEKKLPKDVYDDFYNRREVNSWVNETVLTLVKDEVIDQLVIPKDDTSEYGYAAMMHRKLSNIIDIFSIRDRINIYPGADEVGCVLFSRVVNMINSRVPKVYIDYSSEHGADIIPRHEDRPLVESVHYQIASAGGEVTVDMSEADIILAIHTPKKKMLSALTQFTEIPEPLTWINPFIDRIKMYMELNKVLAVADVRYGNGSDNEFMSIMHEHQLLGKLDAYCGWNTCQNSIGLSLSLAMIVLYASSNTSCRLAKEHCYHLIIESWLFESNIMYDMYFNQRKRGIDPYKLGDNAPAVIDEIIVRLNKTIAEKLNSKRYTLQVTELTLPWKRLFDISFHLAMDWK